MTAPREPDRPGVLDTLLLPEGAALAAGALRPTPRDGSATPPDGPAAPGAPHRARRTRRGGRRGVSWRGVGATLLWSTLQGLFLLPDPRTLDARTIGSDPLVAPRAAVLLNLAVLAAGWWWFVGRPRAWAARGSRGARWLMATLRLRPVPGGAAAWGWLAVLYGAIALGSAAAIVLTARWVPLSPPGPLEQYLRLPWATPAVLVVAAGVAPLFEELFFRGWLQRTLERLLPAGVAIALTALVFGAVHGEAFGFPVRAALGLALGVTAWRTRSVWPGVALHAAYNATVILGDTGEGPGALDERRLVALAQSGRGLALAVLGLALAAAALAWAAARMGRAATAARRGAAHGDDTPALPTPGGGAA